MENREEDLISRLGRSVLREDDASCNIALSLLQLSRTRYCSQTLLSPTPTEQASQLATSFVQNVNPVATGLSFTLQPNPLGGIASSMQHLNGSGSIIKTCRACGSRGREREHWRYVTDFKLRFCNACALRNKREEKKARMKAEAAGF